MDRHPGLNREELCRDKGACQEPGRMLYGDLPSSAPTTPAAGYGISKQYSPWGRPVTASLGCLASALGSTHLVPAKISSTHSYILVIQYFMTLLFATRS